VAASRPAPHVERGVALRRRSLRQDRETVERILAIAVGGHESGVASRHRLERLRQAGKDVAPNEGLVVRGEHEVDVVAELGEACGRFPICLEIGAREVSVERCRVVRIPGEQEAVLPIEEAERVGSVPGSQEYLDAASA
jgi:hypothetical protein